ncbi:SMP-30/gluconolaconase/LRE-like region-containing protein [Anopheles sinensis]|uniref:SMP-30/gluconolaconase/LRE-like region-containing protein n=1 Tax=Anopheles sinensis TaxID=74873 RepID=A0A084VVI9_ANOSI|nr:SMP-30/gluconolaconase/LRE-like region-containing protein [Anopheles sinensis]
MPSRVNLIFPFEYFRKGTSLNDRSRSYVWPGLDILGPGLRAPAVRFGWQERHGFGGRSRSGRDRRQSHRVRCLHREKCASVRWIARGAQQNNVAMYQHTRRPPCVSALRPSDCEAAACRKWFSAARTRRAIASESLQAAHLNRESVQPLALEPRTARER